MSQPPRTAETPRRRRLYAALAALRIAAAVLCLGMIHPDEFFQSQEVMARHVVRDAALRGQLHVPWEFTLPTPNRSVLFPSLVAGLPYKLLEWLGVPLTGYTLLVVPRLLLCIASFGIDALLFRCAKALRVGDPSAVVLAFASSWPVLIFLARPFSNTFETIVLALSIATLLCFNPYLRLFFGVLHVQTLVLGSLLAVGFFTRFTFPFFFLPVGLELVRRQDELLQHQLKKKNEGDKETNEETPIVPLLRSRLLRAASIGAQGFVAFAVWSVAIITIDTWYFRGELPASLGDLSSAVIAPLNNVLYNLQHDNLELHGVHPRVTHALINMPMLFGPLYLAFVITLSTASHRPVWQTACVLLPLVLISLAPHQEPRFLLPLLVPLHLFHGATITDKQWKLALWVAFNTALALFFGVLHQGGVLPLLLALGSRGFSPMVSLPFTGCRFVDGVLPMANRDNMPIVFYKTYMPPRFTLANPARPWGPDFRVVDLAGGHELETQLQNDELASFRQFLLVAPASVTVDGVVSAWGSDAVDATASAVGSCFPHVTTEDLALDKPQELVVYRVDASEAGVWAKTKGDVVGSVTRGGNVK